MLLLDDKVGDTQDLQVHSIVHGVLSLDQLAMEYGAQRRRMRVAKLRGARFRGGYHDFSIETGGIVVFPRLVAATHRKDFESGVATSGVGALDSLLGGGLDRGTSTLIIGPAGSGKSTLAGQFAAAAERGERAAVFIFDEVRETYLRRAEGTGTDMRGYVERGLVTLQQVDPAELTPGEFVHSVRACVDGDGGARLVVVDSLNGYLNAMPEERFLAIHMHELLTYLNHQGVVSIAIMAQHGFLGTSMATPVDVSYLADTVLMLRYFEAGGAIHRALSVVKKRTGTHERTIREMQITAGGVRVGKPLTEFQGVLTGVPVFSGTHAFSGDGSDDEV